MHVLIVPLGAPQAAALARRLAAAVPGAAVVLVAHDDATAGEAGRLTAELSPGRAAVFIGEEGLEEFVQELFSGSSA